MKKTIWSLLAAAALAAGLSGCVAPVVHPEPTTPVATSEPAPVQRNTPAPKPEPAAEPDGVAEFGDTVSWPQGVALTVSAPEAYQRGEWDFGGEDYPEHVAVTVTLKNTGDQKYDPAGVYITASSAGQEGEEIYLDEGMVPDTSVLPGKTISWKVAFGVADGRDVTLDVDPGLSYQPWFDFETWPQPVTFTS